MPAPAVSRRRVLGGLSVVGLCTTLGCLGGGERLTLGVGPAGSRSHAAGQALAVAVDRHADGLRLDIESITGPNERLYAASEDRLSVVAVDNTTLYRASEQRGAFDLDPVDPLPYQGFCYGRLDHYWLRVTGSEPTAAEPAADLGGQTVYPGQPGEPSRLVTEQLLREADRWDATEIDNRHRDRIPEAVDSGEIDRLVAVEINGRQPAPWCRRVDQQVGDRLGIGPIDDEFEGAVEDAPNALAREIEPTGWQTAAVGQAVDGWSLPMQWIVSPEADSETVAELARIAHEHGETIRSVDELALDRSEPAAMTAAVMAELPVHEGVVAVIEASEGWNDDWTVGDAAN